MLGCDGLGAILDDGDGNQSLVRLDQVTAVTFSRAQMEDDLADTARARTASEQRPDRGRTGHRARPSRAASSHFLTAKPY